MLGLLLPAAGCSPGAAPAVLTVPGETAPPSSESETNANPGSIGSASGGAGSEGGEESEGRFTYARGETAVETVGGVVVVLRYDDAAERFVGSATNGNAYGVEVDLDLYLSSRSDEERGWERRLAAGQTEAVSLAVGGSFTRWGLEVEVERESGSGGEGEEGEDESEGRFTYARGETAVETVGGVVVVLRYDDAAERFVGSATNGNAYGVEVDLDLYLPSHSDEERGWERRLAAGQTDAVSLAVGGSFTRWGLEVEVERESGSGEEGEEGEDESEGRFTYARDDTATETVGGVVVVLRYDAAARAFVGQVTNTRSYGLEVELEVYVSSGGYDEREWEAWVRGGQTRTVSLPVRSTSFDRWRLEIEVEREDD